MENDGKLNGTELLLTDEVMAAITMALHENTGVLYDVEGVKIAITNGKATLMEDCNGISKGTEFVLTDEVMAVLTDALKGVVGEVHDTESMKLTITSGKATQWNAKFLLMNGVSQKK